MQTFDRNNEKLSQGFEVFVDRWCFSSDKDRITFKILGFNPTRKESYHDKSEINQSLKNMYKGIG